MVHDSFHHFLVTTVPPSPFLYSTKQVPVFALYLLSHYSCLHNSRIKAQEKKNLVNAISLSIFHGIIQIYFCHTLPKNRLVHHNKMLLT